MEEAAHLILTRKSRELGRAWASDSPVSQVLSLKVPLPLSIMNWGLSCKPLQDT